jgi:hypothetical protein
MSELIACIIEGGNEQFIMNKLLDEEKLIFPEMSYWIKKC